MSNAFEKKETHPSYGTVMFARQEIGGTNNPHRLFGSSLRNHARTVILRICKADLYHELGRDWVFGHDVLAEVELSAAQFSELLTTMNVGSGVPCTIRHMNGIGKPEDPPFNEVEIDRTHDHFKESLKETVAFIEESQRQMAAILEKPSIGKADRLKLADVLDRVHMNITKNMPFYLDQFNQAAQRVANAAKAEVDAFVTGMAIKLGIAELKKLSIGFGEEDKKQLNAPDGDAFGLEDVGDK
ncbi:MAG: hypothetical protein WC444_04475 [Candidatus Paceibacterota bacterium]